MALQVGTIPVTSLQQNCALVWDDVSLQGAVVDPGGEVPRIKAAIEKLGLTITAIYLTHGHSDHAGGAAELAESLGVQIIGPTIEDKFLLDSMEETSRRYGFAARNCTPDTWLEDGDTVTLGGGTFEVRHCPGHTPGHVVFLNHEANFGIMGDVLFRNSIGRTDLPGYGNYDHLIDAIVTKLLPLPDGFAFICGHGQGSTIGAEKKSNPFLR